MDAPFIYPVMGIIALFTGGHTYRQAHTHNTESTQTHCWPIYSVVFVTTVWSILMCLSAATVYLNNWGSIKHYVISSLQRIISIHITDTSHGYFFAEKSTEILRTSVFFHVLVP